MRFPKFTRKKDVDEIDYESLKAQVEAQAQELKEKKMKDAVETQARLAQFNRTVDKYGIDGIWFLAFGGIEEVKK